MRKGAVKRAVKDAIVIMHDQTVNHRDVYYRVKCIIPNVSFETVKRYLNLMTEECNQILPASRRGHGKYKTDPLGPTIDSLFM